MPPLPLIKSAYVSKSVRGLQIGEEHQMADGVPQLLLAVAARHSVVETIARALYWAQTSRRLRRVPLSTRVILLTELLERRVRRTGRRKVERQIVDFYCRSQLLLEPNTDTDTETDRNTAVSRYTVSWPTVRRMLVRRTIEAWGYNLSEIGSDVLAPEDLDDELKSSVFQMQCQDNEVHRP